MHNKAVLVLYVDKVCRAIEQSDCLVHVMTVYVWTSEESAPGLESVLSKCACTRGAVRQGAVNTAGGWAQDAGGMAVDGANQVADWAPGAGEAVWGGMQDAGGWAADGAGAVADWAPGALDNVGDFAGDAIGAIGDFFG